MERDAAVLARKWKESSASLLERDNEACQKKKKKRQIDKWAGQWLLMPGLGPGPVEKLTFVLFLKKNPPFLDSTRLETSSCRWK